MCAPLGRNRSWPVHRHGNEERPGAHRHHGVERPDRHGALRGSLEADGHQVVPVVRGDAPRRARSRWDPAAGRLEPADLDGLDAVVHLAGEGIGEKRWTPDQKRADRATAGSRAPPSWPRPSPPPATGPPCSCPGSAVGYYGTTAATRSLTERAARAATSWPELCVDWEAATAAGRGRRRPGGPHPHRARARPRRRRPAADGPARSSSGVGGRLGSGKQWMSWITLADQCRRDRASCSTTTSRGR